MTDKGPGQEFQALWQSDAPSIDASALIEKVSRNARLQRYFVYGQYVFGVFALIVVGWLDFNGAFRFQGALTAIVAVSLIWKWIEVRRARARCPAMAAMGPEAMLRHALRHARATLRMARFAYALVPLSIAAGMASGPLLYSDKEKLDAPEWAFVSIVLLTALFVAVSVAAGLWVARIKSREVRVLEARLKDFQKTL